MSDGTKDENIYDTIWNKETRNACSNNTPARTTNTHRAEEVRARQGKWARTSAARHAPRGPATRACSFAAGKARPGRRRPSGRARPAFRPRGLECSTGGALTRPSAGLPPPAAAEHCKTAGSDIDPLVGSVVRQGAARRVAAIIAPWIRLRALARRRQAQGPGLAWPFASTTVCACTRTLNDRKQGTTCPYSCMMRIIKRRLCEQVLDRAACATQPIDHRVLPGQREFFLEKKMRCRQPLELLRNVYICARA